MRVERKFNSATETSKVDKYKTSPNPVVQSGIITYNLYECANESAMLAETSGDFQHPKGLIPENVS